MGEQMKELELISIDGTPKKYMFGMDGTKWRIFCVAVHLFAERDYSSISMRDIAEATGIRAASIYNHFASKADILTRLFEYIGHYWEANVPSLEMLLAYVETDPPREVLKMTHSYFPDEQQLLMSKIILILNKQMRSDPRADKLLRKMLIDNPKRYVNALLSKMIELGKIEPIDLEAFNEIYTNNYYGASMRMYSSHPVDDKIWVRAFDMLFDIIRPVV